VPFDKKENKQQQVKQLEGREPLSNFKALPNQKKSKKVDVSTTGETRAGERTL
jgi:hypothetical protein